MDTIYIIVCHWPFSKCLLHTDTEISYNDLVIDNFHSFQLQFQMIHCIDKHMVIYDWNRRKIIWKQCMHIYLPFIVDLGSEQMWLVEFTLKNAIDTIRNIVKGFHVDHLRTQGMQALILTNTPTPTPSHPHPHPRKKWPQFLRPRFQMHFHEEFFFSNFTEIYS